MKTTTNVLKFILVGAAAYIFIWLLMLYPTPSRADGPAEPVTLTTAGVALDDAKFLRAAQAVAYALGGEVVSAQGNAVVMKLADTRRATTTSLPFSWNMPVNKDLQWDAAALRWVYRMEIVRESDKIVIRYLPSWGSESDRMLKQIRAALAERLYCGDCR